MGSVYMKLAEMEGSSGISLATVISTSGSTPVKGGSSALFDAKGLIYGTVGGGVLEGRVTEIAKEYAITGKSAIHHFEFDNDISRKDEAICGGRASVLIDGSAHLHRIVYEKLRELLGQRKSSILATEIRIMQEGEMTVSRFILQDPLGDPLHGDFSKAVKNDVIRLFSAEGLELFSAIELENTQESARHIALLEPLFPRKHLVIAGAGHIGKVLCHLGHLLDFEVTVVDDRSEYANPVNLPDADNILNGDIGKEISGLEKGNDTYIVIVTRGHNDDSNALRASIEGNPAYIGMIGSRTKIAKMKQNFIGNGWITPEKWETIHTPVGIEIGSRTVEEIALSIAAELVLVRNSKYLKS